MDFIEEKKVKAELARVVAARLEMEYIVAQRNEEIRRLEENISIQNKKEIELKEKLGE